MSDNQAGVMEWRAECSCGQMWGRHDAEDLEPRLEKHKKKCGREIEIEERPKQGRNYSDCVDLGPTITCRHCGSGNIAGQMHCAVCGGLIPNV